MCYEYFVYLHLGFQLQDTFWLYYCLPVDHPTPVKGQLSATQFCKICELIPSRHEESAILDACIDEVSLKGVVVAVMLDHQSIVKVVLIRNAYAGYYVHFASFQLWRLVLEG